MKKIMTFEEYFKRDKNVEKSDIVIKYNLLYDKEGNCYYRFLKQEPHIKMYENCYDDAIKTKVDRSLSNYKQYLYMQTVIYKQREQVKQKLLKLLQENVKTVEFSIFECDYAQIKDWNTDEALQAHNQDRFELSKENCLSFVPHCIIRLILESEDVEKKENSIRINLNLKKMTQEQSHKIHYLEED